MQKLRNHSLNVLRSLSLTAILLLSACETGSSNCPPWPIAGPKVADDLDFYCPKEKDGTQKECIALIEWIQRLDTLEGQLRDCR
jgi:hypothetical protein